MLFVKFYTTLIRPHVEYCSSVWTNCVKSASERLERVQLRVARYIRRERRFESTHSDRLRAVNLPTLAWRRRLHQLVMVWKLINGLGTPKLAGNLHRFCKDRCKYDLSRPLNLEVPLSHSGVLSRSLIVSSCLLWNSFPYPV